MPHWRACVNFGQSFVILLDMKILMRSCSAFCRGANREPPGKMRARGTYMDPWRGTLHICFRTRFAPFNSKTVFGFMVAVFHTFSSPGPLTSWLGLKKVATNMNFAKSICFVEYFRSQKIYTIVDRSTINLRWAFQLGRLCVLLPLWRARTLAMARVLARNTHAVPGGLY